MSFLFQTGSQSQDPDVEEIKKLQVERGKLEGRLASFKDVSYDTELYSHSEKPSYSQSIGFGDEEDSEEEELENFQQSKKNFLTSFSAPQKYLEEMKETKDETENDPFKDRKRKSIAEREDGYKARWRKRKLSPDRIDPFQSNGHVDEKGQERNSYRDVMQDVELEKEKAELIRKIQQKEKDKELEQQRKLMEKSSSKKRKKEKHRSKSRSRSRNRSRSRSRSRSSHSSRSRNKGKTSRSRSRSRSRSPHSSRRREKKSKRSREEEREWEIEVKKGRETIQTFHLSPDVTYSIGRENSDILVAHESCSKKHAKIVFLNNVPNIMDLNSTNGTSLNNQPLVPAQYYKLSKGDKINFGCSTRDYFLHF